MFSFAKRKKTATGPSKLNRSEAQQEKGIGADLYLFIVKHLKVCGVHEVSFRMNDPSFYHLITKTSH